MTITYVAYTWFHLLNPDIRGIVLHWCSVRGLGSLRQRPAIISCQISSTRTSGGFPMYLLLYSRHTHFLPHLLFRVGWSFYCPFQFICGELVIVEVLKCKMSSITNDNMTLPHIQLGRLNDRGLPTGGIDADEKGDPSSSDHRKPPLGTTVMCVLRQRGDEFALKCDGGKAC